MTAINPLGLSTNHRESIRACALRSATVGLKNALAVHYTEGPARWSGISEQKRSWYGQFPPYCDCSAYFTWCHWDASKFLKLPDYVNGDYWEGGYTGTMVQHGVEIEASQLITGDAVFYGASAAVPSHVAFYAYNGKVISQGSEIGPLLLPYNYRSDIVGYRRFI